METQADVRKALQWRDDVHRTDLSVILLDNPEKETPATFKPLARDLFSVSQIRSAEDMMRRIATRLMELNFDPIVCQLSHCGVSDPARTGFVATIYGQADVSKIYTETIGKNVTGESQQQPTPIAPSSALYSVPFWHSRAKAVSHPRRLPPGDVPVTFAAYPLDVKHGTRDPERLRRYIELFHQRIIERLATSGIGLTAANVSDFIAVPFRRLQLNVGVSHRQFSIADEIDDLSVQGGVFFALGQFTFRKREAVDQSILTIREELEHAFREELARQTVENAKRVKEQEAEVQQSIIQKGASHEVRQFTSKIEQLAGEQLKASTEQSWTTVQQLNRSIHDYVRGTNAIMEVLNERVPLGKTGDDLGDVFAYATCLLQFQRSGNFSDYVKRGLDSLQVAAFLRRQSANVDIDSVLDRLHGPFGQCVVAVRNLLDNAIKGCGDIWLDDGLSNYGAKRKLGLGVSKSKDVVLITNSAQLTEVTYRRSFHWDGVIPLGFYTPDAHAVSSLSVKGSKLAQSILDQFQIGVELKKVARGTATCIRRRTRYNDYHRTL